MGKATFQVEGTVHRDPEVVASTKGNGEGLRLLVRAKGSTPVQLFVENREGCEGDRAGWLREGQPVIVSGQVVPYMPRVPYGQIAHPVCYLRADSILRLDVPRPENGPHHSDGLHFDAPQAELDLSAPTTRTPSDLSGQATAPTPSVTPQQASAMASGEGARS